MPSENILGQWALCPLLTPKLASPLEDCAYILMIWALLRAAESEVMSLSELRSSAERRWNYMNGVSGIPRFEPDTPYWKGMALIPRITYRVWELVNTHEILHAAQGYDINPLEDDSGAQINGVLRLVRRRTRTAIPRVLTFELHNRPLNQAQKGGRLAPDVVGLARWLAARQYHPEYPKIGLLYYPLVRGKAWKVNDIKEPLARQYVWGILDQVQRNVTYPAPGAHCLDCTEKRCFNVYRRD